MADSSPYPLEIFYDGSCSVCSREMEYYQRNNPDQRLVFIDISHSDFKADPYERTQEQFMEELHVRDATGRFHTGVDAFLALWSAFPEGSACRLFGALINLPLIRQIADLGYLLFARTRFLLPKRHKDCDSETCQPKRPR